jgi:hypothetical protein
LTALRINDILYRCERCGCGGTADALDSGSSELNARGGSNPLSRTIKNTIS